MPPGVAQFPLLVEIFLQRRARPSLPAEKEAAKPCAAVLAFHDQVVAALAPVAVLFGVVHVIPSPAMFCRSFQRPTPG